LKVGRAVSKGWSAEGWEEWMVAWPVCESWVVMWVVKGGRSDGCSSCCCWGEVSKVGIGADMALWFGSCIDGLVAVFGGTGVYMGLITVG
jgi:hypothetical protein